MAWFGTRVYVGAQWTAWKSATGTMAWTEITAANPFSGSVALATSFRRADGTLDPRFFATRTLGGFGRASFLVRDLIPPTVTFGWFVLTSTPTPVVPAATIYFVHHVGELALLDVPIQQLDADGFPLGDAAAQPPPPPPPPPPASLSHPPATELWAGAMFGEGRARTVLELFRRAEAAAGEGKPVEPEMHVEGVLVDDEADEFRRQFGEPPG